MIPKFIENIIRAKFFSEDDAQLTEENLRKIEAVDAKGLNLYHTEEQMLIRANEQRALFAELLDCLPPSKRQLLRDYMSTHGKGWINDYELPAYEVKAHKLLPVED